MVSSNPLSARNRNHEFDMFNGKWKATLMKRAAGNPWKPMFHESSTSGMCWDKHSEHQLRYNTIAIISSLIHLY